MLFAHHLWSLTHPGSSLPLAVCVRVFVVEERRTIHGLNTNG